MVVCFSAYMCSFCFSASGFNVSVCQTFRNLRLGMLVLQCFVSVILCSGVSVLQASLLLHYDISVLVIRCLVPWFIVSVLQYFSFSVFSVSVL